jgi:AcrR family transcriptional regulator
MRRDAETNLRRVLAAAAEVFAEEGLGATLADVARHAGVGVGTVYRRFANKDDLIYDVYEGKIRETAHEARLASQDADPWAGFVRFFDDTIRDLAADRGLRELTTGGVTRSLGWARGTAPDRLAALLAESRQAMDVHLATLVERAKQAGRLRQDFDVSDMTLLSAAVQATIALRPGVSQRVLGFLLDGLNPAGATPLPAPPLAEPSQSESPQPEVSQPELSQPEALRPEALRPEVPRPATPEPESTAPESTAPESTGPASTGPVPTGPESVGPEPDETGPRLPGV